MLHPRAGQGFGNAVPEQIFGNRYSGMLLPQLRSCAREADGCCPQQETASPPLANDLKLPLLGDEESILWQPKGFSGINPIDKNANQALNPSGVWFVP